jgi:hypothetical protein
VLSKVEIVLKGSKFETLEDIESSVTTVVKGHLVNVFHQRIQAWKRCWNACMKLQVEYFIDDHN